MTTDDAPDLSPDDVRRLAALLEKHDLTELRYEHGDVRVTLRTADYFPHGAVAPVTMLTAPVGANGDTESAAYDSEPVAAEPVARGTIVEAPIMGVFYRTSSPADPPFVEIGDAVEVGQVVGLIEAMKVFSEIKSEVAGFVLEIFAQNKALVQPGDPLMVLDAT